MSPDEIERPLANGSGSVNHMLGQIEWRIGCVRVEIGTKAGKHAPYICDTVHVFVVTCEKKLRLRTELTKTLVSAWSTIDFIFGRPVCDALAQ